jgi:hypothetical protein
VEIDSQRKQTFAANRARTCVLAELTRLSRQIISFIETICGKMIAFPKNYGTIFGHNIRHF